MRSIITYLIILFTINGICAQGIVEHPLRDNLVGEKIKFLKNKKYNNNYYNFSENKKLYPPITYNDYSGHYATFIKKENNLYELVDDIGREIYTKIEIKDYLSNSIGYVSILEKAKELYLNKTVLDKKRNKCKIIDITYAEDGGEHTQQYGAYNVHYIKELDTLIENVEITDYTWPYYDCVNEYVYNQKIENLFILGIPEDRVKMENIEERFYSVEDKIEDLITYYNKSDINKENYYLYNELSNKYELNGIFSKIIVKNKKPYLYLTINYYGLDWIFLEKVKMRSGENVYETNIKESIREVIKGPAVRVNERIILDNDESLELAKFVYENFHNEILLRFYGKYYKDVIFNEIMKNSIKESYELYNIMLGNKNNTYKE